MEKKYSLKAFLGSADLKPPEIHGPHTRILVSTTHLTSDHRAKRAFLRQLSGAYAVRLDFLQSEHQSRRLKQLYFCNTESTSRRQVKDDLATDVSFVSLGVSTKRHGTCSAIQDMPVMVFHASAKSLHGPFATRRLPTSELLATGFP